MNCKEYIAFEGKLDNYNYRDKAYIYFIEMLNDQLMSQGRIERFYPIRSDNNRMIVRLTTEQFEIVKKYYPNDKDHPKTIDNLMKSNGYE